MLFGGCGGFDEHMLRLFLAGAYLQPVLTNCEGDLQSVFVTGDGQTINECTSLLAGGVTVQGAIHCVEMIDEHCDD